MKIFFSGIGGSGVSAIAGFMAEKGHQVSGSDRLFDLDPNNPVRLRLQSNGVSIFKQDGSGIDDSIGLAVFSTAVEKSNPDFQQAVSSGVRVETRPEYLAEIVSAYNTVAVAGTSGKSTISGMLAFLLQRLGMSPNFIGGGRVKQFKTEKNPGNYVAGESRMLVVEACESDGTLVNYLPAYTIISNLDLDHHPISETARMFEQLASNTRKFTVIGCDDRNLSSLSIRGAVGFSVDTESEYKAGMVRYYPLRTTFRVGRTDYELSLPGKHNLYNAMACISLLSEMGVNPESIAGILPEFRGIERRFDIYLNDGDLLVIDDYAHNPHKIASLMKTMQGIGSSICYIFQPHGFGPTRLMKEGYIKVFSEHLRETDRLFLLPIYYAGGTAAQDISSDDLAKGISAAGKSVRVIYDRKEIFDSIRSRGSYVVFGARDDSLSTFAEEIAERVKHYGVR